MQTLPRTQGSATLPSAQLPASEAAGCSLCPSDRVCVDIAVAVPGNRICYLHVLQHTTPALALLSK